MEKEIKVCAYRKCENIIENKPGFTKYCCEQHRKNEFKFILKERKKSLKNIEKIEKGDELI